MRKTELPNSDQCTHIQTILTMYINYQTRITLHVASGTLAT